MEEEAGISASEYRQIEQRYRKVGSDEVLEKLAQYFEVPLEELVQRRDRPRKLLSAVLDQAWRNRATLRVMVRSGETFVGQVKWFDLGALMVRLDSGEGDVVLQRHMVDDWSMDEIPDGPPEEPSDG
jgi:transcriptional regulator with XRE-family HTH domain